MNRKPCKDCPFVQDSEADPTNAQNWQRLVAKHKMKLVGCHKIEAFNGDWTRINDENVCVGFVQKQESLGIPVCFES